MGILNKLFGGARARAPVSVAPPEMRSITLLQPESEIGARTDAKQLSAYVEALKAALLESWPDEAQGAVLVAAARPGREARVWIETLPESFDRDSRLGQALSSIDGPVVTGVVSFAVYFSRETMGLPQLPRAWREVAAASPEPLQLPDGVLQKLWPESLG